MRFVVWGGSLAIWAAIALVAVLAWYAYDLPEVADLGAVVRKPSVTLIAADGTLLASYGDVYGDAVAVRDLPPYLPQAVLAVEDRRFYSHFGLDPFGLARAMLANLRAGRVVAGGSTVTQQLAKNLFLSPERTIKRKMQEMLLAFWLEYNFTKDQILGLYLNRVYLGAGTYGVDAAARRYFGKPARTVNLYEAALLAGLLKAPSRYSPASDAARSDERTALVLRSMTEAGFVTPEEAGEALAKKTRGRAAAGNQARYFTDWVMGQVADFVGPVDRDLTVITTLNPYYQRVAEQELAITLAKQGTKRNVKQGAIVLMQPDGAIRALVGGRDYDASQFNRATQALRQPGSAFKAFVFLAALEAGAGSRDRSARAKLDTLKQEALLANPLVDFDELILLKRRRGQAGLPTNHQCNSCLDQTGYDNEIAVLSPVRAEGKLRTLFRPKEDVYVGEIDLAFGGDRLLFTMPNGKTWQIHEIRTDGSGLRQVSRGEHSDVDNFDACYLPDDGIAFASTASYHAVPCWHGQQRACSI